MRDQDIIERYQAGERVVDLAVEYELTIQAIHRILRQYHYSERSAG